jgi:hypothetical protein
MQQILIRNNDLFMGNNLIRLISVNATAAMLAASGASASASFGIKIPVSDSFYEICDSHSYGEGVSGDYQVNEIIVEPLSKKEEAIFKSLNEAWGDDEDGVYENLYKHHTSVKPHAL